VTVCRTLGCARGFRLRRGARGSPRTLTRRALGSSEPSGSGRPPARSSWLPVPRSRVPRSSGSNGRRHLFFPCFFGGFGGRDGRVGPGSPLLAAVAGLFGRRGCLFGEHSRARHTRLIRTAHFGYATASTPSALPGTSVTSVSGGSLRRSRSWLAFRVTLGCPKSLGRDCCGASRSGPRDPSGRGRHQVAPGSADSGWVPAGASCVTWGRSGSTAASRVGGQRVGGNARRAASTERCNGSSRGKRSEGCNPTGATGTKQGPNGGGRSARREAVKNRPCRLPGRGNPGMTCLPPLHASKGP